MSWHRTPDTKAPRFSDDDVSDGREHWEQIDSLIGRCFVRASAVAPADVSWLWEPYLPLGHPAILAGDPGVGKSLIALALAAAGSRGAPLPGDTAREPWATLWLGLEDDLPAVVIPRYIRMGGDPDRLSCYQLEAGAELDTLFVEAARVQADRIGARLVVLDSVLAWAPGDVNESKFIREIVKVLTPLCAGRSVLLIAHNRKAASDKAIHRVAGSLQFSAAVRSVLVATADGDEARVVSHAKSNFGTLGPSRQFTIVAPGRLVWGEVDRRTADELSASPEHVTEREDAETFLRELLADGPVPYTEVTKAARACGIADMTLKRAKWRVGVDSKKIGFAPAKWMWALRRGSPAEGVHPESEPLRENIKDFAKGFTSPSPPVGEPLRGDQAHDDDISRF